MVSKMDHLYAMLDDLDDDLSAMQEDLEVAIELLAEGETKKVKIILEEMSSFLVDFLETEECDDEECECFTIDEEESAPVEAAPAKEAKKPAAKAPAKKPAAKAPAKKAPAKAPAKKPAKKTSKK